MTLAPGRVVGASLPGDKGALVRAIGHVVESGDEYSVVALPAWSGCQDDAPRLEVTSTGGKKVQAVVALIASVHLVIEPDWPATTPRLEVQSLQELFRSYYRSDVVLGTLASEGMVLLGTMPGDFMASRFVRFLEREVQTLGAQESLQRLEAQQGRARSSTQLPGEAWQVPVASRSVWRRGGPSAAAGNTSDEDEEDEDGAEEKQMLRFRHARSQWAESSRMRTAGLAPGYLPADWPDPGGPDSFAEDGQIRVALTAGRDPPSPGGPNPFAPSPGHSPTRAADACPGPFHGRKTEGCICNEAALQARRNRSAAHSEEETRVVRKFQKKEGGPTTESGVAGCGDGATYGRTPYGRGSASTAPPPQAGPSGPMMMTGPEMTMKEQRRVTEDDTVGGSRAFKALHKATKRYDTHPRAVIAKKGGKEKDGDEDDEKEPKNPGRGGGTDKKQ